LLGGGEVKRLREPIDHPFGTALLVVARVSKVQIPKPSHRNTGG
jgi:hypothetical protein